MSGTPRNWDRVKLQKKQAKGLLVGVNAEEDNPLHGLFMREGDRSARLRIYLRYAPSGERDVEPLLDRLAAERAERETWLRDVLGAHEPTKYYYREPWAVRPMLNGEG